MVNQKTRKIKRDETNGNGNGSEKERISVSIPTSLNERLEAFAAVKEKSVQNVVRESVEHWLDKSDAREVGRSACEKGILREGSAVCRYVDEN